MTLLLKRQANKLNNYGTIVKINNNYKLIITKAYTKNYHFQSKSIKNSMKES